MTPDEAFNAIPCNARAWLAPVRALIHQVAAETDAAGVVVEEVKWGQLSLTTKPRTGSPLRLGSLKSGDAALFAHCQTSLISDFAAGPGAGLRFEGNRAVVIPDDVDRLRPLIAAALTYHCR